jgi:signal transduction histidine kinase
LGDAVLLYEAMTNLISNAIKYTPEGGTIRVAVTQEPQAVCFVVMDTGIGIPADRQRNLFQPFARARTQESEDTEGTGLGLHLVKRIVERHSGEIRFTSEYGKGSTFGFQIPIMRRPISKPLVRVKDEGSQTTPPAS